MDSAPSELKVAHNRANESKRTGAEVEHEDLRLHIVTSNGLTATQWDEITVGLIDYCWPAGPDDHACLGSVTRGAGWPDRLTDLAVESCTCSSGRCVLCN